MVWLIAGLALFLGAHSVQIFASGWRAAVIARRGAGAWKGAYTLAALAGLVLIVWGYGQTRDVAPLYALPPGLRHATFGLVWAAFIAITAAYSPPNHIKAWLRDPMVFGIGLWALGHLLVRATPGALALFGAFFVWALADFVSLRLRANAPPPPPKWTNTALTAVLGTLIAALFAHVLHVWLIGVSPFG